MMTLDPGNQPGIGNCPPSDSSQILFNYPHDSTLAAHACDLFVEHVWLRAVESAGK